MRSNVKIPILCRKHVALQCKTREAFSIFLRYLVSFVFFSRGIETFSIFLRYLVFVICLIVLISFAGEECSESDGWYLNFNFGGGVAFHFGDRSMLDFEGST
jgi:hypothetical protein